MFSPDRGPASDFADATNLPDFRQPDFIHRDELFPLKVNL
jgi:hypothetical protein